MQNYYLKNKNKSIVGLLMTCLIVVMCISLADKNIFLKKYNDDDHDDGDFTLEFHTLQEVTPKDMPDLESEESAVLRRNQQWKGLKILTPNQILSRLPISLAQLKAGNNTEKLKNEIRHLLYSLYRSKNLIKTICNNLANAI